MALYGRLKEDFLRRFLTLHLVQAFASSTQLVLGQVAVNEKPNEITAMPKQIELLDIKGRIVTADAMHTQRSTSETIVKAGGDYVLALKGNQGTIHEDVKLKAVEFAVDNK